MTLLQVIVLAIVQGFTEFLPISSSAHLALAPWLLGWEDQGLTFDIALHLGTLLAILVVFGRSWIQIAAQGLGMRFGSDGDLIRMPNLLWTLAAASMPVAVAGLMLKDQAEQWRDPFLIGGMLVGVGILMGIADVRGRRNKALADVSFLDAMIIGAAQALAIVPGTSRSGITITAALFRHVDRAAAARFSFLLSTPAIAGAAAKAFYDLHKAGGIPPELQVQFAAGIAVSAVTGMAVILFFLSFLKRYSLRFFVYYRVVFGIIIIALAFFRRPAG
ncbi:MAG: undecaprenyl-diphosphate phosphatase [Bryobacterales bacterium]|nr:undecaprenyl-diphosphate phosphatase [Bryobacterales bacterium]